MMNHQPIKICSFGRRSHSRSIKNVKNAFLENPANIPEDINETHRSTLENYSHKNIIREPDDMRRLFELVLPTESLWKPGREIRIAFMGGTKKIKDKVRSIGNEWLQYANLKFKYITDPELAHIRIAFNKLQGSWSGLGTDNLSYDSNEPTMNFGWLDADTPEDEFRGVVLHEYGHMMGCGHEHESPKNGGIPWDKPKALKYYMETQGWSEEEVQEQVFDRYSHDQIRGTRLDKKSIMMYAIPNSITIGNFQVGWNNELSAKDKSYIKKIYKR